MAAQHLKVLSSEEYESPELEKTMLAALESPRIAVNDELFTSIREAAQKPLA